LLAKIGFVAGGKKSPKKDRRLKWLAIFPAFLIECGQVKFFLVLKRRS
jgi:hypothetical protein